MASWTDKQKAFVEEYCKDFNGKQAAIRAGYAERSAKVAASRNLNDPDIRAAVDERLEELTMEATEALKRTADIASADIAEFFYIDANDNLRLDREALLEKGGAVVKEITWDRNGQPRVKLYNKQKALRDLLDARGAFNHEQDHNIRGQIETKSVSADLEDLADTEDPEELMRLYEDLFAGDEES